MKLSFSTKGWHQNSFEEFCDIAVDLNFKGIELHNIYNRLFAEKDGAFHDFAAAATLRRLYEKNLKLPCIDTISDIADAKCADKVFDEIMRCIAICENLHIPCIRVRAKNAENSAEGIENVYEFIKKALPEAEKKGVSLVVETSGLFADTATLREVLQSFASDNLGALWNLSAAYFECGESPEQVIKNLGAYVRHVHFTDAKKGENGIEYCLAGEGEMPISDMMLALRSVNYDGFISLVWNPAWCEELDDMEIIFSQFTSFMKQFGAISRNEKALYYNRAHTGKFVWEKDRLIDLTFPQVLDRMVEEFPDQYCFKYTTLDYTRTYSEFRDDVDEFARSLVALGVKAGSKVAVWASNVPQWYIAFWATT
ncbi:MAG: TIM barrel protein, partial [Oscillospiraceae bacterium]|nr:TIM barrel protein [Oscillospiraceae bacterium]